MTIIDQYPPLAPEFTVEPTSTLAFDAYRDIHKGVHAELFAVTTSAGNTDPGDREGRAALSGYVLDLVELLVDHAGHEDTHVLPVLEVTRRPCSTVTPPTTPPSTPGWSASPNGPAP